ncbi:MAG: chemotaxis protein CheW [Nitrospirota bacterium]
MQADAAVKKEQGRVQLAVFRAGQGEYGVDIMKIMEIIRPQKLTSVPKAPEFIEGIINLRGNVVPVIDVRKRLGVNSAPVGGSSRDKVLILLVDGKMLGAVVDGVKEIMYMDLGEIEETPEAVKGPEAQFLQGVGKAGDRLIMVLDPEKLLNRRELTELDSAREEPGPEA